MQGRIRVVPRDLQGWFKGASRVSKISSKDVSRQFQRHFKKLLRLCLQTSLHHFYTIFTAMFSTCFHKYQHHVYRHVWACMWQAMFLQFYVVWRNAKAIFKEICVHLRYSFKEKEIRGKAIPFLQFLLEPTNIMKL